MAEYAWTKVTHTMTIPSEEIAADAKRMGVSVDAYLERLLHVTDGIPIDQALKAKRQTIRRAALSRQP